LWKKVERMARASGVGLFFMVERYFNEMNRQAFGFPPVNRHAVFPVVFPKLFDGGGGCPNPTG